MWPLLFFFNVYIVNSYKQMQQCVMFSMTPTLQAVMVMLPRLLGLSFRRCRANRLQIMFFILAKWKRFCIQNHSQKCSHQKNKSLGWDQRCFPASGTSAQIQNSVEELSACQPQELGQSFGSREVFLSSKKVPIQLGCHKSCFTLLACNCHQPDQTL